MSLLFCATYKFMMVITGVVNISIIGYNFSYFKGTWRKNLFHSELNYLVSFVACFVGTAVNIIGNIVSPVQCNYH